MMKYKKGETGNKEGRPKGAKNKIGSDLRERIINFLSIEFQNVEVDLKKLPPRDRIKLYVDLLQYGLPKYQPSPEETEFQNLSNDQLDEIIEQLKRTANE